MIELPLSRKLPVSALASVFNDVTNSYKFLWLMAILDTIRKTRNSVITVDNMLGCMIARVWYPVHYFRLSFGKQDRLGEIAFLLKTEVPQLQIDSSPRLITEAVISQLETTSHVSREVRSIAAYVPYRFLRVFFAEQLRRLEDWKVNNYIENLAETHFNDPSLPCLYRFVWTPQFSIELHPDWHEYLDKHAWILEGFCLWHLVNYLQKHNPNVPNLAGKLFPPEQRDLRRARGFWHVVLNEVGSLECIYSHQPLLVDNLSLDHFLPWSYVSHDLLWNIIPTIKRVNSSKRDALPDLAMYFDAFARLQYEAVKIVANSGHDKLLEDFLLLLKSDTTSALSSIAYSSFAQVLYDTIAPQAQIARNMGFDVGWRYQDDF